MANENMTHACGPTNATAEQLEKVEPQPLYSSYREFVDQNAASWPHLRWMQYFLNNQRGQTSGTQVTFIDSKDGHLDAKHISEDPIQTLPQALGVRPPDVEVRIIAVSYTDSASIDREVVDVLGRWFDIDPLLFHQHFYHNRLWREASSQAELKSDFLFDPLSTLPSEHRDRQCFHFGIDGWKYASAMFFRKEFSDQSNCLKDTVVIWIRSSTRGRLGSSEKRLSIFAPPDRRWMEKNWLGSKYIDSLLDWPPELVRMANGDVKQFIAPLIRVLLKECYAHYRNYAEPQAVNDASAGHLMPDRYLPQTRSRLQYLYNMRRMTTNLLEDTDGKEIRQAQSPIHDAVRDLHMLIDELTETEKYYDRLKREELVNAQLEEARKSTETALGVARLTKLAFIFIPLSFVTSFFGMNVRQFGNGNIDLWIFFATAAALIGLTFAPFFIKAPSGVVTLCTIKLFLESPYIGLCFSAFALFNSRETNQSLCDLGPVYYLSKGSRGQLGLTNDSYAFGWVDPSWHQRFWVARARDITAFIQKQVEDPDWKKRGRMDQLLWRFEWWRMNEQEES